MSENRKSQNPEYIKSVLDKVLEAFWRQNFVELYDEPALIPPTRSLPVVRSAEPPMVHRTPCEHQLLQKRCHTTMKYLTLPVGIRKENSMTRRP